MHQYCYWEMTKLHPGDQVHINGTVHVTVYVDSLRKKPINETVSG